VWSQGFVESLARLWRVDPSNEPVLRIGELSRRVGLSDHVLRAWESRYGLLHPVRTAGGFRLYSPSDERRVRRMQAELSRGLSAAEAARATLAAEGASEPRTADLPGAAGGMTDVAEALARALDAFDEPAAQACLDRLLTDFTVETVLRDVLVPYLHDLGVRWERGEVGVAREHFATHVLRGRLAGMARGWGQGDGPHAVLACPPGELHDLALLVFGVVLHRRGWRISYVGASTPVDDLVEVVADTRPSLVVLAATTPDPFTGVARELTLLAETVPVAIAGAGATSSLAETTGARMLADDPVTAAEQVSRRR
jgi:MerR family transcriptional regulator, light-induced transcriptional regulator